MISIGLGLWDERERVRERGTVRERVYRLRSDHWDRLIKVRGLSPLTQPMCLELWIIIIGTSRMRASLMLG